MKRHALILSVLIAPGLAFAGEGGDKAKGEEKAQAGQQEREAFGEEQVGEQYGQEEAREYGQTAQHAQGMAEESQKIRGEVQNVDLAKGELKVKKSGEEQEELTLHGSPDQIRQYQEGQQVNVDVRKFGENHWITSQGATASAAGGQTVSGEVANLDKEKGEIELSEGEPRSLKANPQELEQIQPGQQVSVTYEEVEGENWVSSISGQDQPSMGEHMQEGHPQEQPIEGETETEGQDPMMQ